MLWPGMRMVRRIMRAIALGSFSSMLENSFSIALIAASIFTITLVLQRKQAGRGFAIGLSTVLLPAGPLIALTVGNWLPGLPPVLLALLLIRGLRGAGARAWLNEV